MGDSLSLVYETVAGVVCCAWRPQVKAVDWFAGWPGGLPTGYQRTWVRSSQAVGGVYME